MFLPIILFKYIRYRKIKEIEDKFPVFLLDFVESVRAGMTLPQALKNVSKNDYGELSKYVKKMAAQIEWGIPFEKVLLSFSKNSGSKLIARMISTIVESHKFGGNLTDIFKGISETSVEIERLREERKIYLQSQMTTGYVIFFVFLVVLIGLQRFLLPGLTEMVKKGEITVIGGESIENIEEKYKAVFRNLILMEGFFAGLVIGKMSEGTVVAGIKHSFILMVIGIIVFTLAT
ncbi:MAG TPA: hypothetical protein ENG45_00340 [Candidatus Aenigmarchaeota archaeon]|nr:hypothetical protein [Candidatus Aenigmarchaeota archaeon]